LGRQLSESISSSLLLRVSEGDSSAFRKLHDTYESFIGETIKRYIADEDECNDLTQQVFIALWEKREALHDVRSFEDYLFIITRNKVFKYFSNLKKEALIIKEFQQRLVTDSDSAGLSAELHEYQVLWERAVQKLPAQQKQVYTLIEQQEESVDNVAKELHLARGTVKKHLELARKAVRQFISLHLEGGRSAKTVASLALVSLFIF
jgi:RNA polymerase sigma factor (sigma-70 family)